MLILQSDGTRFCYLFFGEVVFEWGKNYRNPSIVIILVTQLTRGLIDFLSFDRPYGNQDDHVILG